MIKIEKPDFSKSECSNCFDTDNVKKIVIETPSMNGTQSTSIKLCQKCREELKGKL